MNAAGNKKSVELLTRRQRRNVCVIFFFFQAEDGIRDYKVTGVQTCALPISGGSGAEEGSDSPFNSLPWTAKPRAARLDQPVWVRPPGWGSIVKGEADRRGRSEEHTSELQSPCNLVCRLLLEKKKRLPVRPPS